MHPIIVRIPLPNVPFKLWWAIAAAAVIALVYAANAFRNRDSSSGAIGALVVGGCAYAGYRYSGVEFNASNLPIYSYGVMLGLSLVVGWYLTLGLAERDGLPKEAMANCYVVTALTAIVGSRLLYVATNLEEFHSVVDVFKLRSGGLVAYGGFLGGFLGSVVFTRSQRLRLLPWGDVAVPSLASGLLITRLGCYMYGCDFGKPLPGSAPEWLQKLGTFPHWPEGTLEHGTGAPAWVHHVQHRGLGETAAASFPVHPTQLYESLTGALLLALLLWVRKNQKFRGQVFLVFVFGYGVLRFLLEIIRDDLERGEYGPSVAEHILLPGALLAFALAYSFGIAESVRDPIMRRMTQLVSLVPAIMAFLVLRPESFADQALIKLSTSQWVGLTTALAAAIAYAIYWKAAEMHPESAMSLGLEGYVPPAAADAPAAPAAREEDDAAETEAKSATPSSKPGSAASPEPGADDAEVAGDKEPA